MEKDRQSAGWVWVIVNEQDDEGHFLGLYDEEKEINFIPAFPTKEAAQDCFLNLPRAKGKKYEVQAIHLEELSVDAEKHGFTIALVDADGKVIR